MSKHIKDFFKTLFNIEPINKTSSIPIHLKPNSPTCMWFKLKEKALAENNEVGNQILRMMTEIELEEEIKNSFLYIQTTSNK